MSKFYGKSSDESSSSESETEVKPVRKSAFNRMAVFSSDESSSDESVVRAKPMKKDVFVDILRSVRSHIKNNDYPGLATDYTDALKAVEKKSGDEIPKAFVRVLYELNSFISELQASGATKKMSQIKAQAVNKLKAQMNKGNKPFEEDLAKCVQSPSEYDVLNEGNDDDSGAESDSEVSASNSDASSASDSDSDASSSDSDDSSSGSSSDSDSSSDSSSGSSSDSSSVGSSASDSSAWDMSEVSSDEEEDEMARRARRMRRWLKDSDESDYEVVKKPAEARRRKPIERRPVAVPKPMQADGEEEEAAPVEQKPTAMDLPEKELIEKARDFLTGKVKLPDARQTLTQLDEMIAAAAQQWGPICHLTLSISTVSYMFDATAGLLRNGSLPDELWLDATARIEAIMAVLKSQPNSYAVSIHELVPEMQIDSDVESARRKRFGGNGMVALLAELVDDEFGKSFQALDDMPAAYAAKLGLLPVLVSLLLRVRSFLLSEGQSVARTSSRILWHLHYQSKKSRAVLETRIPDLVGVSPDQLVDSVFAHGSKKEKAGAILLSAFIAATAGETVKAKRLMSADLFDLIAVSEVSLQIQYNRALAMVGVAAFAAGDLKDSYNLLTDICSTGRLRELLAQGVTRQPANVEKSAEVDRAERRRLLPYHMHLNVELVEAAYSLSAMVLEVPRLSKALLTPGEAATRRLAKYMRQLAAYDRQLFSGPPESAKDAIALAGRAIINDDVERAVELIKSMRIWESLGAQVAARTVELVRSAALLAYLTNNAGSHKNFALAQLSESFGLARAAVTATICRAVVSGDIAGRIAGDLFVPSVAAVSKLDVYTAGLGDQVAKLEKVTASVSSSASTDDETVAAILAELNAPQTVPGAPEREIGARRVRQAGLANAKALAASQQAAEKRLQFGLARRRGWDNARGQPLQGQVVSVERKKLFGKSYGY